MTVRGLERRLFPRKLIDTKVVFEDEFGEGVIFLNVEDISLGGLFISADIPIKIESYVFLSFLLPGSKNKIHATGQVVRVTRREGDKEIREGMGIRFVGLSREAADEISEFIS
jgi:uncharacterized protein (TIGR02266 family)